MTDDTTGNSPHVGRPKLAERLIEELIGMIETGALQAGDTLPSERVLMQRFGTGRPAVREALQNLQSRGLISISHGERSRVRTLSAGSILVQLDGIARLLLSSEQDALSHLKQARRLFETAVAALAAETATDSDVVSLRQIATRQRASLGDAAAFVREDIAFHTRIAATTGNPVFEAASSAMLGWLFRYHKSLLHWSGQEIVTLDEHDNLIALIAEKDADGAVAAMAAHLDRSAQLIVHAPTDRAGRGDRR
jgi:DNA-binding FadR family transcriptional regulator